VEHLVECPSKKEIAQNHFVKVDGVLDAASSHGHVKIENRDSPDNVRLKRGEETLVLQAMGVVAVEGRMA